MNLAIFDIDGTLTDSFGMDVHFYEAVASRLGVEPPTDALGSWTHVTDESILHELFARHDRRASQDDVTWIKARYRDALGTHLGAVPQIPGAAAILDHLRGHPAWHVTIGTGNWGFAGAMKLEAGGVDHTGIEIIGCDERPERTTMMRHALEVARAEAGPFERVVYIGDRPYDLRACQALAWPFVGRTEDASVLERLGASHVLRDYEDTPRVLEALLAADVPSP